MKKLILVFVLLVFNFANSQIYYQDTFENYVNYDNSTIKLSYESYNIEGSFVQVRGKDYKSYLVVDGNEGIHFVMKKDGLGFYGLDVLKGDYAEVLKGLKKGRKYGKKVEIVFSNLPSSSRMEGIKLSSDYVIKANMEREKLKQEKEIKAKKFDKELVESDYLKTFKIKIYRHATIDYSVVDTFGTLMFTEQGITVRTEIPSLGLLRGSWEKSASDVKDRSFVCNVTNGYGDILSVSLNAEQTAGGLTVMYGRRSETTTFLVVE
jgi:hypothetical protein